MQQSTKQAFGSRVRKETEVCAVMDANCVWEVTGNGSKNVCRKYNHINNHITVNNHCGI